MTTPLTPAPEGATVSHPRVYFETDRLSVRSYTISDVGPLAQVMSDPRVHTFTKDKGHPWDLRRTEEYICFMIGKDFQTLDCFHGAVIEKKTNRLIGLCGLNPYRPDEPEIEFKIGVPDWGKGYATELGRQIIEGAFASTGIRGVYGLAHPDNAASRRVLEKIGMRYIGNHMFRNQEEAFYYVSRDHPGSR